MFVTSYYNTFYLIWYKTYMGVITNNLVILNKLYTLDVNTI